MNVKVQCQCGTRFEFEIEPVNERMPMPIHCPACNADATDLANAVIKEQLAAAAAPVVAPVATLRVSKSTHTAHAPAATAYAAPALDPGMPHCHRHPSESAVETCRVCGKLMCAKCMEQFGYVCSAYCRQQAEQTPAQEGTP